MNETQHDLTVEEVAALMRAHRETIRRWLRRGMFPHAYRVTNRYGWRIPPSDVEGLKGGGGAHGQP